MCLIGFEDCFSRLEYETQINRVVDSCYNLLENAKDAEYFLTIRIPFAWIQFEQEQGYAASLPLQYSALSQFLQSWQTSAQQAEVTEPRQQFFHGHKSGT